MTYCEHNQNILAEQGRDALLNDAELKKHLKHCIECSAFFEAIDELNVSLGQLPEIDASDELVARTLLAVQQSNIPTTVTPHFERYRFRWASGFASIFVIVSALGLWQTGLKDMIWQTDSMSIAIDAIPATEQGSFGGRQGDVAAALTSPMELEEERPVPSSLPSPRRQMTPMADIGQSELDTKERPFSAFKQERARSGSQTTEPAFSQTKSDIVESEPPAVVLEEAIDELQAQTIALRVETKKNKSMTSAPESTDRLSELNQSTHDSSGKPGFIEPAKTAFFTGPESPTDYADNDDSIIVGNEYRREISSLKRRNQQLAKLENNLADIDNRTDSEELTIANDQAVLGNVESPPNSVMITSHATHTFLNHLDNLDNITFQKADGYWANTYVPGDPAMRLLQTQLQQWDRSSFGVNVNLEQAATPIWQPFDTPIDGALAAYLHSDKTAINGPTRMHLQIGLQASEREGGQRPAMNLAVVLDMHDAGNAQFDNKVRSLLTALAEAKQTGDRFSLTIAGQPGGLLIPAGQFRHGPLSIAINQLFTEHHQDINTGLSLSQAITTAGNDLTANIPTDSTLGTKLMLLITGSKIGPELEHLKQQVHKNAVDGLLLSAVNLGAQAQANEIDALVLAGQGSRRTLTNGNDAKKLIGQELYAASQAVARAIRLRIQLAPGVKLVQVHGSERLDIQQIEQVKQAENSIDQRLSDNLGITADRGDDEAGIQIIIPAMTAGSSHVVLLDVVAENPGPIADVRVRYKDLISVKNSVSRAQLSIDSQQRTAGQLERNVIKNLLAFELAENFSQASEHLSMGQLDSAKSQLKNTLQLLMGLRRQLPSWATDTELLQDEQLLNNYLATLNSSAINNYQQQQYVSHSMQLAAHRKITGPSL